MKVNIREARRHGKWVGISEGVVKEGVGKNAELGCFRKGRGEVK